MKPESREVPDIEDAKGATVAEGLACVRPAGVAGMQDTGEAEGESMAQVSYWQPCRPHSTVREHVAGGTVSRRWPRKMLAPSVLLTEGMLRVAEVLSLPVAGGPVGERQLLPSSSQSGEGSL